VIYYSKSKNRDDGIGLQMHISYNKHPERAKFRIAKYTEGCRHFCGNRINLDNVKVAES
jgi:hypothetical protein